MLDLTGLRLDFIGRRVLVEGERIVTCSHCGRHVAVYGVVVFHYEREKERRVCPALDLICPGCIHKRAMPVFAGVAGRLRPLPLEDRDRRCLQDAGWLESKSGIDREAVPPSRS